MRNSFKSASYVKQADKHCVTSSMHSGKGGDLDCDQTVINAIRRTSRPCTAGRNFELQVFGRVCVARVCGSRKASGRQCMEKRAVASEKSAVHACQSGKSGFARNAHGGGVRLRDFFFFANSCGSNLECSKRHTRKCQVSLRWQGSSLILAHARWSAGRHFRRCANSWASRWENLCEKPILVNSVSLAALKMMNSIVNQSWSQTILIVTVERTANASERCAAAVNRSRFKSPMTASECCV